MACSRREIKQIIEQLLEILIYLHTLDPPVIHRDIKPSNIIYQPDSKKVFRIDFGSVLQASATGLGTFVGTYGYIAPEQMRGEVSPQSDIYSVAMTLAFLLTGREPSELPRRELKLNLRSLKVNASDQLLEWLDRANAPLPEERFPSARDALEKLRSGLVKEIKVPKGSEIQVRQTAGGIELFIPFGRFDGFYFSSAGLLAIIFYILFIFRICILSQ